MPQVTTWNNSYLTGPAILQGQYIHRINFGLNIIGWTILLYDEDDLLDYVILRETERNPIV